MHALVPASVPLMALITSRMRKQIIQVQEMKGCDLISSSPNRPNIFYEVSVEEDLAHIVKKTSRRILLNVQSAYKRGAQS